MTRPGTGLRVSPERLLPLRAGGWLFAVGIVAFLLIPAALWRAAPALGDAAFRHPAVVLTVHLYTLGWGLSVALGALQQFSVVAFQVESANARVTRLLAITFTIGLVILLSGFTLFRPRWMAVGGIALTFAFVLVAVQLAATLRHRSRPSVASPFLLAALLGLLATGTLGAVLATNLRTGWLGDRWYGTFDQHVIGGSIAWFTLLIYGVSYELSAFFGLTRGKERREHGGREFRWAVWGLTVAGSLAGMAGAGSPFTMRVATALLAIAALLFLWDLRGLYRPRQSNRRHATLRFVRLAHVSLLVLAAGAVTAVFEPAVLAETRLQMAFAFLFFAGWLTNVILGYLHRILPFFVWHNKYWGRTREMQVTRFTDMVEPRAAGAGAVIYNLGLALLTVSIALGWDIRPATLLYGAGVAVLGLNLLWTFRK